MPNKPNNSVSILNDNEIIERYNSGVPMDLLCATYNIGPKYVHDLVEGGSRNPEYEAVFVQRSINDGKRAHTKGLNLMLKCYQALEEKLDDKSKFLSPTDIAKMITALANAQKVIGEQTNRLQIANDLDATNLSIHQASKDSQNKLKDYAESHIIKSKE